MRAWGKASPIWDHPIGCREEATKSLSEVSNHLTNLRIDKWLISALIPNVANYYSVTYLSWNSGVHLSWLESYGFKRIASCTNTGTDNLNLRCFTDLVRNHLTPLFLSPSKCHIPPGPTAGADTKKS